MRIRIKSIMKSLVIVVLLIVCTMLFAACSNEEKLAAVEKYGMSNAFIKHKGMDVTLSNNQASYYIPSSISGDYYTIAVQAAVQANATSSKITISTTANSSSAFQFRTSSSSSDAYADNLLGITSNAKIVSSTITFYTSNMNNISLTGKLYTAIHEMGHTLGLDHITASEMRGYTVMYTPYPASKYLVTDYTEFDRYNIQWKYGS
jgi:hypothetical protein